jgi:hypothetical protein
VCAFQTRVTQYLIEMKQDLCCDYIATSRRNFDRPREGWIIESTCRDSKPVMTEHRRMIMTQIVIHFFSLFSMISEIYSLFYWLTVDVLFKRVTLQISFVSAKYGAVCFCSFRYKTLTYFAVCPALCYYPFSFGSFLNLATFKLISMQETVCKW